MRAYRIEVPHSIEDKPAVVRFAGTQADATAARMALFDEWRGQVKKSDITIKEVEVPTDKAGLVAFLNALVR